VRYIARKINGKLVKDGEFELNVKRGEAGKLSTMLLLKLKLKESNCRTKKGIT
jgi:putative redox protein